jgi:hypothetical protein
MPGNWSREEVETTVADYFAMLESELRGESFNKTVHRRALRELLDGRSDSAIERKHQNISAALIELGYPYIEGYKPLGNYQQLLFDVIEDRLAGSGDLVQLVSNQVTAPVEVPELDEILAALDEPPARSGERRSVVYERARQGTAPAAIDYLGREARNAALGTAGERFVIKFEKARLHHVGCSELADRVEHVSVTEGPAAGFDVRSFNADGTDRLIEVKTTGFGKFTPFYVTRNEVETSVERADAYTLYRAFRFRKRPRLFILDGSLRETCRLDPVQYVGRVA